MKYLATTIAACVCAASVGAEVLPSASSRMTLLGESGACFAVVEIDNLLGTYNRVETITTEYGDVLIRYETIGGHNPTDDDIVTVVDLPPGVAADPMEMKLPDGDKGQVCLMESVGM